MTCKAGCPKYPSKVNPGVREYENKLLNILKKALYHRQRRNSGFWDDIYKCELTLCEYSTMLMFDEQWEAAKLTLDIRLNDNIQDLIGALLKRRF